jgi:uncharacterized membrane protein
MLLGSCQEGVRPWVLRSWWLLCIAVVAGSFAAVAIIVFMPRMCDDRGRLGMTTVNWAAVLRVAAAGLMATGQGLVLCM